MQVGRYHPSRTIVVRRRGQADDARRVGVDGDGGRRACCRSPASGSRSTSGEQHLDVARDDRRAARHPRPRDARVGAARPRAGRGRAARDGAGRARRHAHRRRRRRRSTACTRLLDDLYVVDLAWLRSTPWRERVAAAFDPPAFREELRTHHARSPIRHREDSVAPGGAVRGLAGVAAAVEAGRAAAPRRRARLPGDGQARRRADHARARSSRSSAPGLSGVTIESASGVSVSLDRAPGGLREVRRRARRRLRASSP